MNLNETYKGIPTVGVVFRNTKQPTEFERVYTYLIPAYISDIQAGDLAIVEDASGTYAIVTIKTVHEESKVDPKAPYRYKWLVGSINPTLYNELITLENQEIERLKEQSPTRV
jgi:hypothetical protein